MWILPKKIQSLTSVSVLDTKESEKDLEEFCQMSEKSLMWRSKPSQLQTWLRRWKRNSWIQHLSTRTLKPFHTKIFLEKYLSLVEDFRVSHLVFPGLEKLQRTQDTSFHTSQKESESANLELFSSKMLKESSPQKQKMENQFSDMSSDHWKDWVTEQRREYSQRAKLAFHIKEKGSLSWGTPKEQDCRAKMEDRGKHNLGEQVQGMYNKETFPTPQAADGIKPAGPNGQKMLSNQVNNWRTICQRDYKDSPNDKTGNAMTLGRQVNGWQPKSQLDQTKSNTNGKPQESLQKGYLNADWVEQLMGLPIGWTDFDSSEME